MKYPQCEDCKQRRRDVCWRQLEWEMLVCEECAETRRINT